MTTERECYMFVSERTMQLLVETNARMRGDEREWHFDLVGPAFIEARVGALDAEDCVAVFCETPEDLDYTKFKWQVHPGWQALASQIGFTL